MKNNSDILDDSHIEYFTNEKQTQTSREKNFYLLLSLLTTRMLTAQISITIAECWKLDSYISHQKARLTISCKIKQKLAKFVFTTSAHISRCTFFGVTFLRIGAVWEKGWDSVHPVCQISELSNAGRVSQLSWLSAVETDLMSGSPA